MCVKSQKEQGALFNGIQSTLGNRALIHLKSPGQAEFCAVLIHVTAADGIIFRVAVHKICSWHNMFKASFATSTYNLFADRLSREFVQKDETQFSVADPEAPGRKQLRTVYLRMPQMYADGISLLSLLEKICAHLRHLQPGSSDLAGVTGKAKAPYGALGPGNVPTTRSNSPGFASAPKATSTQDLFCGRWFGASIPTQYQEPAKSLLYSV